MACENGHEVAVRCCSRRRQGGLQTPIGSSPLLMACQGHLEQRAAAAQGEASGSRTHGRPHDADIHGLPERPPEVRSDAARSKGGSRLGRDNGYTLFIACENGHLGRGRLMLKAKARWTSWRFGGACRRHVACQNGNFDCVCLLLKAKATVITETRKARRRSSPRRSMLITAHHRSSCGCCSQPMPMQRRARRKMPTRSIAR